MTRPDLKKLIPLLLMIYTIAGVCGFINEGYFFKRGTTYGPWIPIYGFGALLIFFLTVRFRGKPLLVFLISSLACGTLELSSGFILDKVFHLRLWDYSGVILNWGHVNGYICVRSVITWGIFGLLLMMVLLPLVEKFQKRRPKAFNIVTIALFSAFVLDIVLSLSIKYVGK